MIVNEGVCCFALIGGIVEEVRGELNRALSRKCWVLYLGSLGGFPRPGLRGYVPSSLYGSAI